MNVGAMGRRLSGVGLLVVLLALGGLSVWGAVAINSASDHVTRATRETAGLEQAGQALAREELADRDYQIRASAAVVLRHADDARVFARSLLAAAGIEDPRDRAKIAAVLRLHRQYVSLYGQLFAAIDAKNTERSKRLERREDPLLETISRQVHALAKQDRLEGVASLHSLVRTGRILFIATPAVFVVGLVLLAVLAAIYAKYRKRAVLNADERRVRELIEGLPLVTYMDRLDGSGSLLYVSPQIESLLGYSAEEWRRDSELFARVLHPDDREEILAVMASSQQIGDSYDCEYRLIARDGHTVWVHDKAGYAVDDVFGAHTRGFLIDITERRAAARKLQEAEDRLRHGEKLEAVGRLAGGIAHDFNNLLTAILAHADHLVRGLARDERTAAQLAQELRAGSESLRVWRQNVDPVGEDELHDLDNLVAAVLGHGELLLKRPWADMTGEVDGIANAAESAAALTRQLLVYSRRQVLRVRVYDLDESLAGLGTMLTRLVGDDVQLKLSLGASPAHVQADPDQLTQVITNLVVNARDAMPAGGEIRVTTDELFVDDTEAGELEVAPGRYVRICVEDDGEGIDEATRANIFDPFFTTKDEGTGLGLATALGVVQQSGGAISLETEVSRGAVFRVYLPRTEPEEAALPTTAIKATAATAPSTPEPAGETILLVEDQEIVRAVVQTILVDAGYTVLESAGPAAALRISADLDGPIDLVLSDVSMPEMLGPELTARLAETRPGLRLLFMSGYLEQQPGHAPLPVGAGFIQKPFHASELLRAVSAALYLPSATSSPAERANAA